MQDHKFYLVKNNLKYFNNIKLSAMDNHSMFTMMFVFYLIFTGCQ